ncbi:ribosome maturation factor RimM [Rubrivivax gelatinosus]|nr:ribosome maturation factor RimM [Rubrivivax gelatinosus]
MGTTTPPLPALDAPARPADAIEVGRVVGAWGVKGGIKVKPFSSDPQALFSSKRWFLEPSEAKPGHVVPALLRVVTAREQGEVVVAAVHDVSDRDAAQALSGARVYVPRSSFPTPDADEFYWVDLIGLDVHDRAQAVLGRIVGLIETGPHCVLRVQPADAEADEILIPFVAAYIDRVDLAGRTVHVDWAADY